VTQHYLQAVPVAARPGEEVKARLVYQPRILGFADVAFQDKARGQEHKRTYRLLALPPAAGQPIAWGAAETVTGALDAGPGDRPGTSWDDVPDTANDPKKLKALEKALVDFLYNQAALLVFQNKQLDLGSQPGEDREAFLQRCREAARKASEAELATLREKYRPRLEPLEAGLKASQTALQQAQASARPAESVLGMGEALLSYFWSWGSRPAAANPAAQQQVRQVQTELERRQAALQQAQAEWSEAVNQLQAKWQAKVEDVKETRLTPRKSDVKVTLFGLAWAPFWHLEGGGAYGMKLLPAYARPAPGE
jgi:hypothetical protein